LDALNLTPLQTGEKRNRVSSPTARLGLQNPDNALTGRVWISWVPVTKT
jgi:hypothetical protein